MIELIALGGILYYTTSLVLRTVQLIGYSRVQNKPDLSQSSTILATAVLLLIVQAVSGRDGRVASGGRVTSYQWELLSGPCRGGLSS